MSERQVFLVYLAASLLLIALMAYQVRLSGGRDALTHGLRLATSPVVEGVAGAAGGVRGFFRDLADLRSARRERDRLRREVERLRGENFRLAEAGRENERLRRLLDLRSDPLFARGVAARVLADLGGGPQRRAILVDRGWRDGVGPGWVAVRGEALVGRVLDAQPGCAEVLLIVDPDSGVAVRHEQQRFSGVLRGGNRGPSYLARLEYVARDQTVAVGDALISSGLDGLFPPGLLVGYIRDLRGDSPLTWKITVEVAAAPGTLEEVLLIPPQRGAPSGGGGR